MPDSANALIEHAPPCTVGFVFCAAGSIHWLAATPQGGSMNPGEPPERAAPSMTHAQVHVTERRGGARVAGDDRTQHLVEIECVVCPATLGDGS